MKLIDRARKVMLRKAANRRRRVRAKLASLKAPVERRPPRVHRKRSRWCQHGVDIREGHRNRKTRRGYLLVTANPPDGSRMQRRKAARRRAREHRRRMERRT